MIVTKWKRVKILGVSFTLPEVRIEVQPLNPKVVEQLKAHHAAMADCHDCHKFYNGRYHLSLITHLVDGHGVDSFVAIKIMEDLGSRTLAKAAARRAAETITAS